MMQGFRRIEWVLLAMGIGAVLMGSAVRLYLKTSPPVVPPPPVEAPALIAIHVSGAVRYPGLYRLRVGSRVGDAITRAGGPTEEADLRGLNLALPLRDGDRIVVPQQAQSYGRAPSQAGRINLNTASVSELEALPGIGPVLAQRIVEHRERAGPFRRVEDLLKVSGIGPKLLARLRPFVTVK